MIAIIKFECNKHSLHLWKKRRKKKKKKKNENEKETQKIGRKKNKKGR
jgi:hypothetical protein